MEWNLLSWWSTLLLHESLPVVFILPFESIYWHFVTIFIKFATKLFSQVKHQGLSLCHSDVLFHLSNVLIMGTLKLLIKRWSEASRSLFVPFGCLVSPLKCPHNGHAQTPHQEMEWRLLNWWSTLLLHESLPVCLHTHQVKIGLAFIELAYNCALSCSKSIFASLSRPLIKLEFELTCSSVDLVQYQCMFRHRPRLPLSWPTLKSTMMSFCQPSSHRFTQVAGGVTLCITTTKNWFSKSPS